MTDLLKHLIKESSSRIELWSNFIEEKQCRDVAEIGVFKGDFASAILSNCSKIKSYYMLDPWRSLNDWNKPANSDDASFEKIYAEALEKTNFVKQKRIILKGKTTDVIEELKENSIDFAYIDADHTLKGITIDLIKVWDKIKGDGYICGDDFSPSIWQHDRKYEPSLVFPFAVYFAEAMDVKIFALPFNQFLIAKEYHGFEFINLSNFSYEKLSLLDHIDFQPKSFTDSLKKILVKFFKK